MSDKGTVELDDASLRGGEDHRALAARADTLEIPAFASLVPAELVYGLRQTGTMLEAEYSNTAWKGESAEADELLQDIEALDGEAKAALGAEITLLKAGVVTPGIRTRIKDAVEASANEKKHELEVQSEREEEKRILHDLEVASHKVDKDFEELEGMGYGLDEKEKRRIQQINAMLDDPTITKEQRVALEKEKTAIQQDGLDDARREAAANGNPPEVVKTIDKTQKDLDDKKKILQKYDVRASERNPEVSKSEQAKVVAFDVAPKEEAKPLSGLASVRIADEYASNQSLPKASSNQINLL